VVSNIIQLSVSQKDQICVTILTPVCVCRFPLEIAFRIYDNCLASGIEAIFSFSVVLLQKNEEVLLTLKFDEILAFMKTRVFDKYKVSIDYVHSSKSHHLSPIFMSIDRPIGYGESRKCKSGCISSR
jgi:hypothetical protein